MGSCYTHCILQFHLQPCTNMQQYTMILDFLNYYTLMDCYYILPENSFDMTRKCNISLIKIWVKEKVNFLARVHFKTCEYIHSQFRNRNYKVIILYQY